MNRLIKIVFLWLPILLIYAHAASAQAPGKCTIFGRVVDAQTGEALMLVNVFIANTMMGTTTNQEGFYSIKDIPLGTHELVVSMIGYEVQTVKFKFVAPARNEADFRLEPKVLEAPEITVEAADPKTWRKHLRRFNKEFLGRTENASQCEILNPEYLDFEINEESDLFTATAEEPLEIVNHALGYRIYTVLMFFVSDGGGCEYMVMPKYTELTPKDGKEKQTWAKNRLTSYLGSFRHFFTSLVNLRLDVDGFAVGMTRNISPSVYYAYNTKRSQKNLFSPGDFPSEMKLHFDRFLKVEYFGESDEFSIGTSQISYLEAMQDTVIVHMPGYLAEPNTIVKYGRWWYDRMAESLPHEYAPDSE